jgi:hypothetical protein
MKRTGALANRAKGASQSHVLLTLISTLIAYACFEKRIIFVDIP